MQQRVDSFRVFFSVFVFLYFRFSLVQFTAIIRCALRMAVGCGLCAQQSANCKVVGQRIISMCARTFADDQKCDHFDWAPGVPPKTFAFKCCFSYLSHKRFAAACLRGRFTITINVTLTFCRHCRLHVC